MVSRKKSKSKKVPMDERHIISIGGGSFANSQKSMQHALRLIKKKGKAKKKILIATTATGDADSSLVICYKNLSQYNCDLEHLPFFARTPPDLESLVLSQDMIFVGGGNTKSMLAVWREYGFDKLLEKAWSRGIVLCGSSAGGICWFDQGLTDSYDISYTALDCLGFLPGSCSPHYDGEVDRRETFHTLIKGGKMANGIALDECVGVHFQGRKLSKIISPSSKKTAYSVKKKGRSIEEKKLQ